MPVNIRVMNGGVVMAPQPSGWRRVGRSPARAQFLHHNINVNEAQA